MRTLPDQLHRQVDSTPDAVAIVHGGLRHSYGALWCSACRVARVLRDSGVTRGDRVALLADSSFDYVVGYYGTLLSGAVVVALNARSRLRDLSTWIRHSGASALLLDSAHREADAVRNAFDKLPAIDLATVGRETNSADTAPPSDACRLDDLAAILYTSGTTGSPKGVVLSHRNLAANTESILGYLHLNSSDSVLAVLPFSYSYGNSVLHTHLTVGARLEIENHIAFPTRILERLSEARITGFAGVPSTFALLMNRADPRVYDLSALRYITQAGGAMSKALATRLRAALPGVRIFVMYGQTEATARLSYLPPEQLQAKLGSVGIPVSGVELQVRNEDGVPLRSPDSGEIWAKGPNVMQGYWRDNAASARVLVDGWLRTGDLGHFDEDGYLYIDGRSSEMIKTGAHRVSPYDIEEVISSVPGVAEVAVVGIDDELLGQVIKAFVVPTADSCLSEREVLNRCRAELAIYKIPKQIEFIAELPKTHSGKLQRHRLS